MKNIDISVINEGRLNQIEYTFDKQKEIRDLKFELSKKEDKLLAFLKQDEKFGELYREIEEETTYYWARMIDFVYEEAFRDGLKFLMNSKA